MFKQDYKFKLFNQDNEVIGYAWFTKHQWWFAGVEKPDFWHLVPYWSKTYTMELID